MTTPAPAPYLDGAEWIGTSAATRTPREAWAPNRGVLHLTDVIASSMRRLATQHKNPPHTWWDRRTREHLQTVRLDHNSRAILSQPFETNHRGYCFQVECHDRAASAALYTDTDLENLARDVIVPVSHALGLGFVPYSNQGLGSEAYGPNSPTRMSRNDWLTATRDDQTWDWCLHQNIPGNSHWDGPFNMARLMNIAREIDQETDMTRPMTEWHKVFNDTPDGGVDGVIEWYQRGLTELGHYDGIIGGVQSQELRRAWLGYEVSKGYANPNARPGRKSIVDFIEDLSASPTALIERAETAEAKIAAGIEALS